MNIAILGYGTIGTGVYEIALANKINVKKVLDLRETGLDCQTKDFNDIVSDPEISVVVECMGGEHPAYDFVKASLEAGKSVVTSNKAVVAAFGEELVATAKKNNVKFLFEASVGGGIPILRVINECLACDDIVKVSGILNGTTNFILTKMDEEGASFEEALKEAQKLGYAEANPSADVDGWDTCRKTVILGWLISGYKDGTEGKLIDYKTVPTTGVTKITKADIDEAKKAGKSIKLLGTVVKDADGNLTAEVKPTLVDKDDLLSSVKGVMNAIKVESKYLGTSIYYGAGAGKLPTASAVIADVLKCED